MAPPRVAAYGIPCPNELREGRGGRRGDLLGVLQRLLAPALAADRPSGGNYGEIMKLTHPFTVQPKSEATINFEVSKVSEG